MIAGVELSTKDRWLLSGVGVLVAGLLVLIAMTIDAGREGVARSDAWTATAAELARAVEGDLALQVVDARTAAAFADGHIAGSLSLPAEELVDASVGASLPWPQIVARATVAGVDPGRRIVVYAADPADAAYVVWVLRAMGAADVRLLAGGVNAWLDAGGSFADGGPGRDPSAASIAAKDTSGAAAGRSAAWPAARVGAPDPEWAVDLVTLYASPGETLQFLDVRPAPTAQIAIAGAATYNVALPTLVDGHGMKRSRIAVRRALAPLEKREAIVYGDDVRQAALAWWVLASEGRRPRLFFDGFTLWEASGLPTEPARASAATSSPPPGRRQGGGCG